MTAAVLQRAEPRVAEDRRGVQHRILFLADHLGHDEGGRNGVHGVATYLLDVLPALKAMGNEVGACFLRHPHPTGELLREAGIEVLFLDTSRFDPRVVKQVEQVVRHGRYRILHCTQYRASLAGRALARRHAGLRAVLHVHDLSMPPAPIRWLNRALASDDDLGICVSWAASEVAERGYHVRPGRVRVLHTGIDTLAFQPLGNVARAEVRRELGIGDRAPVLCLVGRFDRVKGHREMIEIFASVLRRIPDAVLVLVGDGPERGVCEQLARKRKIENRVRFLGYRRDVARWLGASDVAVVPSRSEGLCRAAIEANLCGLPAVAYDVGGLSEALPDPACGVLVPAGDEPAFIGAIERVLGDGTASVDHARARAARERFGIADHVRALCACYDEIGE